MEYEVILSKEVQKQFRKIIDHLLYEFKSEQAAINVTEDLEETMFFRFESIFL